MDIISHGLWGAVLARAVNHSLEVKGRATPRLQPPLAFFFGVFPDLAAFTPIFVLVVYGLLIGQVFPFRPAQTESIEALGVGLPAILAVTKAIYACTHSLVIFAACFFVGWLGRTIRAHRRRLTLSLMPFEMGAWLFHILIDIPTHSVRFYPTPFLWPIMDYHIDGIPWSNPFIFSLNVIALMAVYWWTRRRERQIE